MEWLMTDYVCSTPTNHKADRNESNASSARHPGGRGRVCGSAEFRLVRAGTYQRFLRVGKRFFRFARQHRNILGARLDIARKRLVVVNRQLVPDFWKAQEETSQGRQ